MTAVMDRYSNMRYRRCGRSGLLLPPMSLGLWHNFGASDNFDEARLMVRGAFDLGITHFDLANNYGPPPGSAEETFGLILREGLMLHRDELIISTKAGYRMWPGPYGDWGSRKYLISSLDQSLRRMGLDYVDIFYSHRRDPSTPLEETMGALADVVRAGKALYVGISNYDPESTLEAASILRDAGVPLTIHQPAYNLFNRTIETQGLLPVLEKVGAGCIAFSPLAQGMLSMRYLEGIPVDSRAAKRSEFLRPENVTEEKLSKVRQLVPIARDRGVTVAQLAILWILRHTGVTSALMGASRIDGIAEIAACATMEPLAVEEVDAIEAIFAVDPISR